MHPSARGVLALRSQRPQARPCQAQIPRLSPQRRVPELSYLGVICVFTYIAGHSIGPSEYVRPLAPPPGPTQHVVSGQIVVKWSHALDSCCADVPFTFSSVPTQTPPILEGQAQFAFSSKAIASLIHSINKHLLSASQCHSQAWAPPISCDSRRCPASELSFCKKGARTSQSPLWAPRFPSKPSTRLL